MSRSAGRATRATKPPPLPEPPGFNTLVASARVLSDLNQPIIRNQAWQTEGWSFYTAGGEIWFAVNWKANALSRVRLRAAKLSPDSSEPEFADSGPAAEIVGQLAGGVGGQAALMRGFGLQLSVPGEANLIIYDRPGKPRFVGVRSNEDVRVKGPVSARSKSPGFELRIDEKTWETLPAESLVVRIWDPDPRHHWEATSMTRACLVYLREIDYYNRKILAQLLSRLASNGFLLLPEGITFPVNPAFKDAPDPFVAELIDIASRSIKNPGTAAAAIPIPLRVNGDFIEKIRHLTFFNEIPESDLVNREKAIGRLAATVDMPQEVLTGLGDTNHWNAAGLDAEGVKKHIAPMAEIICHGLTEGYLYPMLQAAGQLDDEDDGTRWIVWYDPSELTAKPDLSERAVQLSDKLLIDDDAARREAGFDESDAPTDEELAHMLVRQRYVAGGTFDQAALDAIEFLTGRKLPFDAEQPPPVVAPPANGAGEQDEEQDEDPVQGQDQPPDRAAEQVTAAVIYPHDPQLVAVNAGAR